MRLGTRDEASLTWAQNGLKKTEVSPRDAK